MDERGDHLRDVESGAVALAELAKRIVGDSSHRRQHHGRPDRHRAERMGRTRSGRAGATSRLTSLLYLGCIAWGWSFWLTFFEKGSRRFIASGKRPSTSSLARFVPVKTGL